MQLTTAQKATLKSFVEADSALNALRLEGNYGAVLDGLHAQVTPAFYLYRTAVTLDEIQQNGFDWVRVDNLSVGKARIWEWMFSNEQRTINPNKLNVRAGIDETWKGTAADLAVRAQVYVHCKRIASVLEELFATGTGSEAVPGEYGVDEYGELIEGEIDLIQLVNIWR